MSYQQELWIVGTDEVGTETQKCDGWTFFGLPANQIKEFEKQGKKILAQSKLSKFHASTYKKGQRAAYVDFLRFLRSTLEGGGIAHSRLIDQQQIAAMKIVYNRVIKGAILKSYLLAKENAEAIIPYLPVVFTAIQVLEPIGNDKVFRVYHDEHLALPDISEPRNLVFPPGTSKQWLIEKTAIAYRDKYFKSSPCLAEYPVEVFPDDESIIIQAADVLGNFNMNYIFVKLGRSSRRGTDKAKIFEEVFGDTLDDTFYFSEYVERNGNDFILKRGGLLDFKIFFD